MEVYRFRFKDRTTVKLNACSMISAIFAARDWHTHAHCRSGDHMPVLMVRCRAAGVERTI